MKNKCAVCGVNEVDSQDEVCELCSIGQDPYLKSLKDYFQPNKHIPDTKIIENSAEVNSKGSGRSRKILIDVVSDTNIPDDSGIIEREAKEAVHVTSAGQVTTLSSTKVSKTLPTAGVAHPTPPITTGIIKNLTTNIVPKTIIEKWAGSVFYGLPFPIDNEVSTFQVFPDYSGTTKTPNGNACDQVIVYGKVIAGTLSENNEIEVYGRRDSNNNIVSMTIRNVASGTTVSAKRIIQAWVIRLLSMLILGGVIGLFILVKIPSLGSAATIGKDTTVMIQSGGLLIFAFLLSKISKRFIKWSLLFIIAAIINLSLTFFPGFISDLITIVIVFGFLYVLMKSLFVRGKRD